MPDRRKPPVQNQSRPDGARLDGARVPADSDAFSIESTTMRLKSMKLRRAETEREQVEALTKPKSSNSVEMPVSGRPSGRVRHDERGMAVWDWAVASGEFATLSQTDALKKLGVADLKIEDAKTPELKLETTGRDKGGGFDPYNQRGSGKRQGEAAHRQGVTGSAERTRVFDQLLGKKK